MEIQERKSELISRLSNVQSPAVLDEIEKILDTSENQEFDFETEWLRKESPIGFSFEYNLEEDAKNGFFPCS